MPSLIQFAIGSLAVVCFVVSAVASDRMARELRHTGEARYQNPRVRPGVGFQRYKWDLGMNYSERFPARKALKTTASISGMLGALLIGSLLLTWTLSHRRAMETTYQYSR
jgi:hypothetical protein